MVVLCRVIPRRVPLELEDEPAPRARLMTRGRDPSALKGRWRAGSIAQVSGRHKWFAEGGATPEPLLEDTKPR